MNDYWDYLAHAQKAKERDDHKYVARVEVGTKNGRVVYRYFYDEMEYRNYLRATGKKNPTATAKLASLGQKIRQTVANAANTAKEAAANTTKNIKSAVESAKKKISKVKETCSNILKKIGKVKISQIETSAKEAVEKALTKADAYFESKDKSKDEYYLKDYEKRSAKVLGESVADATSAIYEKLKAIKTYYGSDQLASGALAYELRARGYDAYPDVDGIDREGQKTVVNTYIDQIIGAYKNARVVAIYNDGDVIDFTDYQRREYFDANEEWYQEKMEELGDEAGKSPYGDDLYKSISFEFMKARNEAEYIDDLVTDTLEYGVQKQQMEKRTEDYKKYGMEAKNLTRILAKESGENSRGVITCQNFNGEPCYYVYEVDKNGNVSVIDLTTGNANVNLKSLRMYNVCYIRTDNLEMHSNLTDHVGVR